MNTGKESKQKGRPKKSNDKAPYKNTKFCENLNKLFGKQKESQETVAKALNTTRQTVGNWLAGRNQPDYEMLVSIANYYNVSCDYLLGLSPNETKDENKDLACNITGLSIEAVERLADWNEPNFKIFDELIANAKLNQITYLLNELQKTSNLFMGKGIPYNNNYPDMRNESIAKELVKLIDKCDSIYAKIYKEIFKLLDLYDDREKCKEQYSKIIDDLKVDLYIE